MLGGLDFLALFGATFVGCAGRWALPGFPDPPGVIAVAEAMVQAASISSTIEASA